MSKDRIARRIKERKRNAVDPESFLIECGAIQQVETEEQLSLTSAFESNLESAITHFEENGVDDALLADLFDVDESEVIEQDRPYTAYKIIYTIRKWPSPAAFVFDAAAHETLGDFTDEWATVPPRQRYRILQSLRSFQDACFFCGGDIVFNNTAVESCCSERSVLTLHCERCDRRFLEFNSEDPSTQSIGSAQDG